jgi:hypothetical protein
LSTETAPAIIWYTRVLDLGFESRRHGGDGGGRLRLGAHGEDVAQRMVGGDAAEEPGIVDEGAEEIHRVHHGLARRHAHHGGIVRRMQADQHVVALDRVHPASARDSTEAPTLAPQPPQRMAMAEMACALLGGQRHGVAVGRPASAIGSKSVNLRMKRRSIQSFQRQSRSPRA